MYKNKYYATFKSNCKLKDHYIIVFASSPQVALTEAEKEFPTMISMIYSEVEFDDSYFPAGLLATINN